MVIAQLGICYGSLHIFWSDGVHFSMEGCDMYFMNLALGLKSVTE